MFDGPRSGPDTVMADDPGPWSVAIPVFRMRSGRADRRRAMPPLGFMLSPPPALGLETIGLEAGAQTLGAGPVTFTVGVREPAHAVHFAGERLVTISPHVSRSYALPGLDDLREERPSDDPAAGLPPPVSAESLAETAGAGTLSPDGALRAITVAERGAIVVALMRTVDGSLARWMRGCWCAGWSPDGSLLAVGGDWGVVLAEAPDRAI